VPEPARIGFAGTPEFAVTLLDCLIAEGFAPKLVLTQPDRPTGRGRKTRPSPVRRLADQHRLPVLTPERLKNFDLGEFELDLLIVAAYGLILPAKVLRAPRLGCLNVHASLLPRWRGAAPVERAIIAGDRETGVCLMQMDEGLDTGPVYRCTSVPIRPDETGSQLEARLADTGGQLLLALLPELEALTPRPQPETGVTYAEKLSPADSELDLAGPPDAAARRIRALTSRQPVTVFLTNPKDPGNPVRMRCLGAARWEPADPGGASPGTIVRINKLGLWLACGEGQLCIPELQLNRGKGTVMTAKAAANGYAELIRTGGRLHARAADATGQAD